MVSSLGKRQEHVCARVCVCVCVSIQKTDKKNTRSVLTQEVNEKQAGVEEGVCVRERGAIFYFQSNTRQYSSIVCIINQSINKSNKTDWQEQTSKQKSPSRHHFKINRNPLTSKNEEAPDTKGLPVWGIPSSFIFGS